MVQARVEKSGVPTSSRTRTQGCCEMTVLVLTEDFDPTADMVIDHLRHRRVPVLRCDTSWFPSKMTVDAELIDGQWVGNLLTPGRGVRLGEVRSVWY